MDTTQILLLLLGIGLLLVASAIRRRSLRRQAANRSAPSANRSAPSPAQETQGAPPELGGHSSREEFRDPRDARAS